MEHVRLDLAAKEADGNFARRVLSLRPDLVIDMICFEPESAHLMVEALREQKTVLSGPEPYCQGSGSSALVGRRKLALALLNVHTPSKSPAR